MFRHVPNNFIVKYAKILTNLKDSEEMFDNKPIAWTAELGLAVKKSSSVYLGY